MCKCISLQMKYNNLSHFILKNMTFLNPLFLCLFSLSIKFVCTTSAESDTYIVHMDLAAMPKAFSSHHSWFLTTLSSVSDNAESSTSSKLVYSYTNAINGFSAVLTSTEFESIRNSPGYVSSIKDTTVKLDTTRTSQFLGLNSDYGAWPASDYGKDIIVGVVDSGVWPESKSYKDDGMTEIPSRWKGECQSGTEFNSSMCNKKLIGARYFNKGILAKNPNLTISMNSARDTDGHGTHTSSTAAGGYVDDASFFGYASGISRGMAPKARVAMYKALWDEGAYLSDILAAIDQAIIDGVDVLSLSLGVDGIALYADPIAIATFAAVEKGIFVSTSAGNEGPYVETLHNGTPWVLNVAAGTIDREFQGYLTLGNGDSTTGSTLYPGNSSSSYLLPIVYLGNCENESSVKAIANKIVVCLDTNETLGDQVYYVQNNGKLLGGVFISNFTDFSPFVQSSIPALFFHLDEGQKILDYVRSNHSMLQAGFTFRETRINTKPSPKLASYSSRGPSQSCPFVLKPDIMAPGDLILASWPSKSPVTEVKSGLLYNNFNIISGTSMSTPHAAGVAALVKGAHPDWSPAAIRSAMMTTSYVTDNTENPIKDIGFSDLPATPLGMGAGHIDPNKALDPGLVYDAGLEDYINLLCGMKFNETQIKTIVRSNSYNCSNPSLDLNYPSFIAYFNGRENSSQNVPTTKEFQRTVTNIGDESSVYVAKLTLLDGVNVSVSPEKLEFSKKYEKKSYKLWIEDPKLMKNTFVYGYLTWIESNGKHSVRSPIVAINLTP